MVLPSAAHFDRLLLASARCIFLICALSDAGFLVSHSQTVTTIHPLDLRASPFLASRSAFAENFFAQNSRLVLGVEEAEQLA